MGCASDVRVEHRSPSESLREDLDTRLTSGSLSKFTRDSIDRMQLGRLAYRNPLEVVQRFRGLAADEPDAHWRLAAAEILLDTALDASPQDASLYLASAMEAQLDLEHSATEGEGMLDSRSALAAGLYRRAIGELISLSSQDWLRVAGAAEQIAGEGGTYELSLRIDPEASLYPPSMFDSLTPTDRVHVAGMRHHHRVLALGAPVTCIREQEEADPPRKEPLIPPEGLMAPATVTLVFGKDDSGAIPVSIELWNVDRVRSIERCGVLLRLSEDTTAPIATLYSRAELVARGHRGMTDVRGHASRIGIYLHEAYDPAKIPVVLVHGLRSSPATWRDVLNDLRANPVIRERYQFWMFFYPSGLPIPRSAYFLRRALAEARETLDPDGVSEAMSRMVLIGHSMGGVLSKAMVQENGTELWSSLHPEPFDALDMPESVRSHLCEVFFYEPDAHVARVVFVATPHRGSSIASSLLGRLGDSLVDLSEDLREGDRWLSAEQGRLPRDSRYQLSRGVPSGIDDLRPDAPHLLAYAQMPIKPGVPYHTIAGNGAGDSDGVVPLESALLDGAESELVLDAGHDVHAHPLAIRELRRILLLHAEWADAQAATDD